MRRIYKVERNRNLIHFYSFYLFCASSIFSRYPEVLNCLILLLSIIYMQLICAGYFCYTSKIKKWPFQIIVHEILCSRYITGPYFSTPLSLALVDQFISRTKSWSCLLNEINLLLASSNGARYLIGWQEFHLASFCIYIGLIASAR